MIASSKHRSPEIEVEERASNSTLCTGNEGESMFAEDLADHLRRLAATGIPLDSILESSPEKSMRHSIDL